MAPATVRRTPTVWQYALVQACCDLFRALYHATNGTLYLGPTAGNVRMAFCPFCGAPIREES